jgi:hypothetical protein
LYWFAMLGYPVVIVAAPIAACQLLPNMLCITSLSIATLQLDQQFDVVFGFLKVSNAVLVAPATDVLDDVALQVWDAVGMDVLDWLNLHLLVVVAINLHV